MGKKEKQHERRQKSLKRRTTTTFQHLRILHRIHTRHMMVFFYVTFPCIRGFFFWKSKKAPDIFTLCRLGLTGAAQRTATLKVFLERAFCFLLFGERGCVCDRMRGWWCMCMWVWVFKCCVGEGYPAWTGWDRIEQNRTE